MIQLRNLERVPRTYEIPITLLPGQRLAVGRTERDAAAPLGVAVIAAMKTFPQSVTLSARGAEGDSSDPLPDAVAEAPLIAAAAKARRLSVITLAEPTPAPTPAPAPPTIPSAASPAPTPSTPEG